MHAGIDIASADGTAVSVDGAVVATLDRALDSGREVLGRAPVFAA